MYLNCYEHIPFWTIYMHENKYDAKEFINSNFVKQTVVGYKVIITITCIINNMTACERIYDEQGILIRSANYLHTS